MTNAKELRRRARAQLKGRYAVYLLPVVILSLVDAAANFLTGIANREGFVETYRILSWVLPLVSFLVFLLVSNPMAVGLCRLFLLGAKTEPNPAELVSPFRRKYFRTVKNLLFTLLKILCWTLILIVPGVKKLLDYAMAPFILAEEPELDDEDVCEKSKTMMQGNRWRLVKLLLSFWLWLIPAVLTMGLGLLFLWPYLHAALAQFYLEVKQS